MTNWNDGYTTSTNYYSTSGTTTSDNQSWYYYNTDGEMLRADQPPQEHQHVTAPSHNHTIGMWNPPAENNISLNGEPVVKFNDDVQLKVNGEWVSVEDMMKRLETMEVVVEKLFNLLPEWQKRILNMDVEKDSKDEKDEYLDPDLFKV